MSKDCTVFTPKNARGTLWRELVGYNHIMMKQFLIALIILVPCRLPAQGTPAPTGSVDVIQTGKILDHISCKLKPEQSYALYLPTDYSAARRWPIVYSFDPGARGTAPLEVQKDAAERNGYILAASNNSRNGPWKPEVEAADAMVTDTQTRFSIDEHRIYFAGFSGGARVASQLAMQCKCAAGVLLSGAGFPTGKTPERDSSFAVFSAVGNVDFNYIELISLQEALEKAGAPHWLRIFDGPHEWAPAAVMEEALPWFRLQAMKTQREPRDAQFVEAQFAKAKAHAESLESSGDALNAWREYLQIAATYDSLLDVGSIRAKADAMGKDKAVRDGAKRERTDFDEQARLEAAISNSLSIPPGGDPSTSESDQALQNRVLMLRTEAEKQKREDRARVYKRALSGVFVEAMESGEDALQQKNYAMAIRTFLCAAQARPDSQWALRDLAVAQAQAGKRKDAITTLRHARELFRDKSSFDNWLKTESSFDRIRSTPEFDQLLKSS